MSKYQTVADIIAERDQLRARVAELERELAAVQAREAKLREACGSAAMWLQPTYTTTAHAKMLCHEALSQPADDSALREMIEAAKAEEREACAMVCDPKHGLRFAPNYADGLRDCAAAIRARKG